MQSMFCGGYGYYFWVKEDYIKTGGDALWEIWSVLNNIFNARQYGYLYTLQPRPGEYVDLDAVNNDMFKLEYEWEAERSKRADAIHYPIPFQFTKLPINQKIYLHKVLEKLRKKYAADKELRDIAYVGSFFIGGTDRNI